MKKCYINVYSVAREFGGHEEGGWWYNEYTPLHTVKISKRNRLIKKYVKKLHQEFDHLAWGNIYSMLGGEEIRIMCESRIDLSACQGRPYYC